MDDFGEFAWINAFQMLVAALKFLERFDGRLGHAAVRFLRASNQYKLVSLGYAFVPVVIVQTNAQQARGFGRGFRRDS